MGVRFVRRACAVLDLPAGRFYGQAGNIFLKNAATLTKGFNVKKHPAFRYLPAALQKVVKSAAHEISKQTYLRERDHLTTVALTAHRGGGDAIKALAEAVAARTT